MELIEDIIYYVRRYIIPSAFLIIGAYLLVFSLTPAVIEVQNPVTLNPEEKEIYQDSIFMYGALVLILGSVVWFLYLLGIIKSKVGYIVMAFLLVGSAWVLYYDYFVIQKQVQFNKMYAEREDEMKVRIIDIKTAQLAYKDVNEVFTNDMDELISFIKTGKKMDYVKNGRTPERKITPEERDLIYGDNRPIDLLMSDEEATNLARRNGGKIDGYDYQRDTVFVPVMEAVFNDRYEESREKLGAQFPFNADSLKFVPFSKNLVVMDTASVPKGDYVAPTLLIQMTHPMEHPIDGFVKFSIGSLDDNHLRESWDK